MTTASAMVSIEATVAEQWRVGTGHLILIRHLQGIQKVETCPCSQTSPPPERGESERPDQTANCTTADTYTHTDPSGVHRHAILTQQQNGDRTPHCETRRRKRSCSGMSTVQPWGGKMKRKSERRRVESRKKRCAAHNSDSEAEPHSDIYIEITGKKTASAVCTLTTFSLVGRYVGTRTAGCARTHTCL